MSYKYIMNILQASQVVVSNMNCQDCWYCAGDDKLLCVNPNSEKFGNKVEPNSSCPSFSNNAKPDREAENIIYDKDIIQQVQALIQTQQPTKTRTENEENKGYRFLVVLDLNTINTEVDEHTLEALDTIKREINENFEADTNAFYHDFSAIKEKLPEIWHTLSQETHQHINAILVEEHTLELDEDFGNLSSSQIVHIYPSMDIEYI
jgi:hypothetical protein